jgi:hypothetical protein
MLTSHTQFLDHPAYIPQQLTAEFCIEDCLECMRACEQCANSCLRGMPLRAMIEYRALLLECADMAAWTARAIAQGAPDAANWCWLCARMSEACADECAACDQAAFHEATASCLRCAESCCELVAA